MRRGCLLPTLAVLAFLAVIALVIWLAVTQPWNTAPRRAELVGVWQDGSSDRRLVIYPSHRIVFKNMPKGIVNGAGRDGDNTSPKVTESARLGSFWNYYDWGGVSGYYELANGKDEQIYSTGNSLFGFQLSLLGGDDYQYHYDFHRISKTP